MTYPPSAVSLAKQRRTSAFTLERKLGVIWCKALQRNNIGRDEDFFDAGGESVAAAQILAAIQTDFGLVLAPTVLLEAPTIQQLASVIDRQSNAPVWSPLAKLQPGGCKPPFFCVHGVGGEVLVFLELARHFAPDQPFFGLRAPGSDGWAVPYRCIEDLAAFYVGVIRAAQPHSPYYLGGFSFGGCVALEIAQQLHAQGEEVALLAILDHTLPPLRYRRFVWSPGLPIHLAINTARWVMEDIWRVGAGKRLTTARQKAIFALKQFLNLGKLSAHASGKTDVERIFGAEGLPDDFRQVLQVNYQALREYTPKRYPGRVTLFRAQTRPLFRWHGLDLGWAKIASGGLDIIAIPGNHETILKEPRVHVLALALKEHLQRAQASCHNGTANGSANGHSCR
jgi:thioesterase domain-containing protein